MRFGPRTKTQRAKELIDKFDELERSFLKELPFIFDERTVNDGGIESYIYIKLDRPVDEGLYCLAAEIIYHLNSALDQLAVGLVRASGSAVGDRVYFPFSRDEEELNQKRKKTFKDVSAQAWKIIEDAKPYKSGDAFFRSLRDLTNVDKHNELLDLTVPVSGISIRRLQFLGASMTIEPGSLVTGLKFATVAKGGEIRLNPDSEIKVSVRGFHLNSNVFPYEQLASATFIGFHSRVSRMIDDLSAYVIS